MLNKTLHKNKCCLNRFAIFTSVLGKQASKLSHIRLFNLQIERMSYFHDDMNKKYLSALDDTCPIFVYICELRYAPQYSSILLNKASC